MAYRIEVERRAQKEMGRLPKAAQARVVIAIEALGETPRPAGCQPVQSALRGRIASASGNTG